ncbi:pyridoxal-phosphate-dependent aminotransferase family protein [Clostridium grantii]|uniref:Aspartate aminotransferase n=1 Tax=Clostridium grantii DSM 8605 TaxID=1121316 RepID=A0A1M5VPU0_9CLOT|nr:alanine--glyoxylate aminotransferase family protein [Clostridium grantii]SHH77301.1 aspartate aminotransferase [Clostridium grantii DSM 8605]
MNKTLIMTPGPTYVNEEVRLAMAQPITNPDLDMNFYEFYKDTCGKLKELMKTKEDVLILSGEAILGLEAACASLIEPRDKVLCIDNGIFGKGFGDFAKIYNGDVTYYKGDYRKSIDVEKLEEFLKTNHDFKIATIVHCETPSGITNPVNLICPLLKKYGIISIVDSVSAIAGENIEVDNWEMDIVIGGTQKCLSAPPGLTFLSISQLAWHKILNRNSPILSFYANLSIWKNWYKEKWFPYTQPISDIYALNKAVELALKDDILLTRHESLGKAVRESFHHCGLELYALNGFSNTVTTVNIPEGITYDTLFNEMITDHSIMIAGGLDFLKDKVFRIGHMGENCREDKLYLVFKALNTIFIKNNIPLEDELHKTFINKVNS